MRRVLAGTVVIWAVVAAARSAVGALGADYWDPVTPLDYASIWTYSAALALSATIVWQAAWLARSHRTSLIAGVASGSGFAVAGAANGIEDGLGVSAFGIAYVFGVVVGAFGTLVFAFALRAAGSGLLAGVAALLFVPFLFLTSWVGLILVLPAIWVAWRLWSSPITWVSAPAVAAPAPEVAAASAPDVATPS